VSPAGQPNDTRALAAIDLGAESCRVSLLRWESGAPRIEMVHRILNGPVQSGEHLHWPLDRILSSLEDGLRKAAELAPEGIRSLAVDGWAVDMVRLDGDPKGERRVQPIHAPYCYRDERTVASKAAAEVVVPPEESFALTGAQPLRINTVYQLLADHADGVDPKAPWLLLPEYVLYWLGARPVAEYTNATHTGLVDIETGDWHRPLFARLGLTIEAAPEIVPAGTILGKLRGKLAELPAYQDTVLIAPACHDTASAIAAVTHDLRDTAYIVSGTWSLVGTVIDKPICIPEAEHDGFTNQGEAAGGYCFHTNVNGMWMLKQCLDHWASQGRRIELPTLIAAAGEVSRIPGLINVDAPPLLLAGEMPERINHELESAGMDRISDESGNEPVFARVIFASLAARYTSVLQNLEKLTGRSFRKITVLGGGSRNALLARLTEQSTGLQVIPGEVEGSTLGNFAVQLAALDGAASGAATVPAADLVRSWASYLSTTTPEPQSVEQ
jgi:rhamnulokinase